MSTTTLTLGSITYWAGGFDRVTPPVETIGAVSGSWDRLNRVGDVMLQGVQRDPTRFAHLGDIVAQGPPPRLLFWQHANWFDLQGYELLHRAERLLAPFGRYRGYLCRSDWNVAHVAVFVREAEQGEPHLWVANNWDGRDPDEDRTYYGFLKAQVGDDGPTLMVRSVMSYPYDAGRRIEQHKVLKAAVAAERGKTPGRLIGLLAGSFNGPMSGPNEPVRDWELAAREDPEGVRHKGIQREDGSWGPDTRPMDVLTGRWSDAAGRRLDGGGWHSLGDLDGDYTATVADGVDPGGPLRINDFLVTDPSVLVPRSHRTHPTLAHAAKKHRYITTAIAV